MQLITHSILRGEQVRRSDLEIILARAPAFSGAPSCTLNFLQFLAHESEPLLKLLSFDFYHDAAMMTADASLGAYLKISYQDGILLAAIRAGNIDCFVFEHRQISRANLSPPRTFGRRRFAGMPRRLADARLRRGSAGWLCFAALTIVSLNLALTPMIRLAGIKR